MFDKQDENIEGLSSDANEIMAENKYYYKQLFLYDKHIKYKNFKKQYTEMFKGRFPNENENNVGTHYNEREDYMDIP